MPPHNLQQIDIELQTKSLTLAGSTSNGSSKRNFSLIWPYWQLVTMFHGGGGGGGGGRGYLQHVVLKTRTPSSLGQNVLYELKNHLLD